MCRCIQEDEDADNYFVIISREGLPQLPYSVDEIYGLWKGKRAGKYREARRIYNEMYHIYGSIPELPNQLKVVITEDSNSGYDFFRALFGDHCISSRGKSNIKHMLLKNANHPVLAIVDGAAFGPEMQECMELAKAYP